MEVQSEHIGLPLSVLYVVKSIIVVVTSIRTDDTVCDDRVNAINRILNLNFTYNSHTTVCESLILIQVVSNCIILKIVNY